MIIYLPILGIAAGELMVFFGHIYAGLAVHIITLQAVILALIFSDLSSDTKKALQSLILLPLMRIINLTMPQFFTITLLGYPLIYGVMYIPVYFIIKNQQIPLKVIGINSRYIYIYVPSAIFIGTAAALAEYSILNPLPLIENVQISNLVLMATVMFLFVAAVEELIFRSILQTRLEDVLGLKSSILLSGILFGIMHSAYGIVNEVLFASLFGIVLGYIFHKTKSFPFILIINGTLNVLLFGILPIVFR